MTAQRAFPRLLTVEHLLGLMTRTVLCLALLSVAACSTPPTTYERGTLTRPPPAQQRPGVGAPTYDPHAKPIPPQPQPVPARVLPQTPETARHPGLWSSEEPRAGLDDGSYTLLGVRLPTAPEATREVDRALTAICAHQMKQVISQGRFSRDVTSLPGAQARCIASKLYAHCADGLFHVIIEQKKAALAYDENEFSMLEAMKRTANAFHREACRDVELGDMLTTAVTSIYNDWGTP